jgi:protein-glutamine gamma-glutamyltransferase
MKFRSIYRASFYLMLTLGTLVLSMDATDDNPYALLYPLAVALASVLAFLTVDRNPKLSLSREAASWLALGTIIPLILEWKFDNTRLLLAAAHWLVYLQLVKMFIPKTVEDDWFLFLLGLVQVLVGGVISQSDKVGIALFTWALLALWVLSLFALHRESLRMKDVATSSSSIVEGSRSEPYQGLIDTPYLFSSARVAATTLALGGLIFLAMPRRPSMVAQQNTGVIGKHLTGFDDEVQLGQLGEILENDSPVMSVELSDRDGARVTPDEITEYRWRGVSMDRYVKGRWHRPKLIANGYTLGLAERALEPQAIRQTIKLEPTDSPILFGLRPILNVDSQDPRYRPELNEFDGSLFRPDPRVVTFDYTVDSSSRLDHPQSGESYPSRAARASLIDMPETLREKLRPIALAQVEGLAEDDFKGRALALERYLRDSGEFRYSLQMEVTDPDLDPVEDFLINRKSGHCEYFASALTLLLRSIDVPARMINGFKGGDYNAMAGITTVRQKHAHSWVEALVGRTPGRRALPIWLTLDPTPSDQRNASVARVGGMASNFYQVTDFIRYVWVFYIVGFNSERQDRFLYGPIRLLIKEALRGFTIIGEAIKSWLHFPSVGSFFSLRGFFVSFLALLLLVVAIRILIWVGRRIFRRFSSSKSDQNGGVANIQFYRRLLHLLRDYGLERPPAETPLEFARRAEVFLAGRGSGTETVADVPPLVVDFFYQIRFGDQTIREDDFDRVTARLDALEAKLHPPKT